MKLRRLVVVSGVVLFLSAFVPPSTPDCIVGPELLQHPLSNVGSYLQIFTSIRFPCSGKIVRWNYYSRAIGTPVYFGVWEAINTTTFRLVDYNRIIPNRTGLLHEDIYDPTEFINVSPGLYLGVHYDSIDIPQDKQVVPYADAIKPAPYTVLGLADGFPVGAGHNQIVNSNGYVTFTGILFKNWRLPALQASVKFLIDCGKPPVIPAAKATFKTTLAFSTAVYQCNSGHRLVGSPIATCQSTGLWSPPPICDINDLCFAGPDLYDSPLESASSLLQLFPSLTFACGGFVGRWWFYSRVQSRIVYLSVWRQVPGTNAVKLVGANRILAANRGLNYFRVPDDDMVFVDPGDFIGIFYERPDLSTYDVVVPFAAEHNLVPYTSNDLTETLLLPMGRLDVGATNGYIDLTKHADGAIAYWRVPALRGFVISVPVCPQPPLVAYATIAFSSTKVGSLAVYSCVQGYTLYGENPIKCQTSLKWSGSPECRLIPRCPEPPTITNAVAYFNATTVSSFVTYFCKSGFVVNGQNPLTCLTNLTWSQPYPRCILASACPPPPVLVNGHLTMTGTLQPRGAVAFYSCRPGFVMIGATSVFCTDDRSWSMPPMCAPAVPFRKPGAVPHLPVIGGDRYEPITRRTTPQPPRTRWPPAWPEDYWVTKTRTPCKWGCGGETPRTTEAAEITNLPIAATTVETTTSFVSFNVPSVNSDTGDGGHGTDSSTTMGPGDGSHETPSATEDQITPATPSTDGNGAVPPDKWPTDTGTDHSDSGISTGGGSSPSGGGNNNNNGNGNGGDSSSPWWTPSSATSPTGGNNNNNNYGDTSSSQGGGADNSGTSSSSETGWVPPSSSEQGTAKTPLPDLPLWPQAFTPAQTGDSGGAGTGSGTSNAGTSGGANTGGTGTGQGANQGTGTNQGTGISWPGTGAGQGNAGIGWTGSPGGGTGGAETAKPNDNGITSPEEGVVLVRTAFSDTDILAPNLIPAIIVPIIIIILIVVFAIVFAWLRYDKQRKEQVAEAIDYSGQPYYENVKHGLSGTAPPASIATGYARGSHSSVGGYNDQYAGAGHLGGGGSSTKTDDDVSEISEDFVRASMADLGNVKRTPNFFMTTNGGPLGPATFTHQAAGAVVPPPPPPLPPPPAYRSNTGAGGAVSFNNSYYARGAGPGTRNNGDYEASTLKRNR